MKIQKRSKNWVVASKISQSLLLRKRSAAVNLLAISNTNEVASETVSDFSACKHKYTIWDWVEKYHDFGRSG
jgi:hypothetical protein